MATMGTLTTTAVADLTDVTKVYAGPTGTRALDHVTVGFDRGTFTAVMGPSGSGKSTLLHCAAGLDRPTSGRVRLAGTEIGGLREPALTVARRGVGFVFQSFNLVAALTVEQNVLLPQRLAGRRPDRRRAREVLARVGLAGKEKALPGQLSGGQQQRVAVARALAGRPEVIFGDEPTGALDLTTGREVLGLLRHAVDSDGAAVVMVTHDPNAAAWADRVVFLADGQLAGEESAPTAEQVAARMTELSAR
ncbi:ABC transporter ATP-binding protein [Actinocatenispora rupis]|uniref:ABC transporter ATP-binding protein n=1 Tax=Actinocatenispora rupis TaxID=519421 RepID=A0A8J3JD73_9ACTN|nr:ABC transporter ATP-binding protein [Actinocatenispora rupis]GID14574.1 ABC transporter ATP-binding protein [Actinocatenispora rupis]